MRRAFLILVSIIIASIMMISKGDWYSEWARNYRPIFDIDGTGQPQNCVWVSKVMTMSLKHCMR